VKERNEGERVEEKRETRVSYVRDHWWMGERTTTPNTARSKPKPILIWLTLRTKIIIVIIVMTYRAVHPPFTRYPNLESHFPIDSSITQLPISGCGVQVNASGSPRTHPRPISLTCEAVLITVTCRRGGHCIAFGGKDNGGSVLAFQPWNAMRCEYWHPSRPMDG